MRQNQFNIPCATAHIPLIKPLKLKRLTKRINSSSRRSRQISINSRITTRSSSALQEHLHISSRIINRLIKTVRPRTPTRLISGQTRRTKHLRPGSNPLHRGRSTKRKSNRRSLLRSRKTRGKIIVALPTLQKHIIRIRIRTVVQIHNNRILKILIPEPLIPNQIIGPSRHRGMRNRITTADLTDRRQTKIIIKATHSVASNRTSNRGHQIRSGITRVRLLTHKLLKISPEQTIRNKKEKRIKIQIIHERNDRSGQTSKRTHPQIHSITRKYLIHKHRDQIPRRKSGLIPMRPIKSRTRNINTGNLSKTMTRAKITGHTTPTESHHNESP
ncbi:hypothetical protein [Microviridae sp.]|nr:hypothetical protein [Microviridae sp.]